MGVAPYLFHCDGHSRCRSSLPEPEKLLVSASSASDTVEELVDQSLSCQSPVFGTLCFREV